MDRRSFLKFAALAGLTGAVAAGLKTVGAATSPFGLPPKPIPPDQLPQAIPRNFKSPLRVAQWYDYWPGRVLQDFKDHIQSTYGANVDVQWTIYTSNEELLNWMAYEGRRFDVIFPTEDLLESLKERSALLALDLSLLPNFQNLFPEYQHPAWATDKRGNVFATAYMAGTTGLAYRTDRFAAADVEAMGWDLLWQPTYEGTDLSQKLGVLDDCREIMAVGLKKVGFDATGTALVSGGQWSLNTKDLTQVAAARDSMDPVGPRWQFSDVNNGPYLAQGILYAAQLWSQNALYAIRPSTVPPNPIDFVHPKQGFTRWVDSASIPFNSDNVYVAHLFIDFLLRSDVAAQVAQWNLGTTPNAAAYDLLTPINGWDPRTDPRLYPDPTTLARGEFLRSLPPSVATAYADACTTIKT